MVNDFSLHHCEKALIFFSDRIGSTIKSSADRMISHFSFPVKVEATMAKEKKKKKKKIDQKIGSRQTELSNEKKENEKKKDVISVMSNSKSTSIPCGMPYTKPPLSKKEYEKELEKRFGMKVTAAEPTSTPPTFDATPKSSKDCVYARDYELLLEGVPALTPDASSGELTYSWDPGYYCICVRLEDGIVKSSPPDGLGGICESDNSGMGLGITQAKISNGTYNQSGKIYFEFYLEDDSGRIINGNFSGEFYNPMDGSESYTDTPIFCQVKGTATGVVEDDMWNPNNGEILQLQTSFSTNVITSFGE